jgi:hypothetical protein
MTFIPRFREEPKERTSSDGMERIRDVVTFTSVIFGTIAALAAPTFGTGALIALVGFGLVGAVVALVGRGARSPEQHEKRSGEDRGTA